MARKNTKILTFSEKLKIASKKVYNDIRLVNIGKQEFLIKNKNEIIEAYRAGYSFLIIAEVATEELLQTDIPKNFILLNKDNEEVEAKTQFRAMDIKLFCESNLQNSQNI